MWTRPRTHRKRHCGHFHLQGLRGSVAIMTGFQLQCTDCWTLLDGSWTLALVNRDPDGLHESQEDWHLGKMLWGPDDIQETEHW